MASSSAGAPAPVVRVVRGRYLQEFQWPLRRPGRCAAANPLQRVLHHPRFNGLFVGRGAAPDAVMQLQQYAVKFQWPLRRPGRCAMRLMLCFHVSYDVSMASSSAGALRRSLQAYDWMRGFRFNGLFVGRALRRATSNWQTVCTAGFQWPLRRPGRCADGVAGMLRNARGVSMASSSAGALRPDFGSGQGLGARGFNGLFVGRGAAPRSNAYACASQHVSMASSSAGALRRKSNQGVDTAQARFNGLFVGRGAAPTDRPTIRQTRRVSMASSSAGALRRCAPASAPWQSSFQWPLRRPGAAPTRPALNWPRRFCFNGLFVGRGAAPVDNYSSRTFSGSFQWPLRRPGRCACPSQNKNHAQRICFNGLFVGRGAAPALELIRS